MQYKLIPNNAEGVANSGIQFRAILQDASKFTLRGYQGEMDTGTMPIPSSWPKMASMNGCLTDDPGPCIAAPGQKVSIKEADGGRGGSKVEVKLKGTITKADALARLYRPLEWNDYRIVAIKNHIQIWVNGVQTVDAVDERARNFSGHLGLQLHAMNVAKTIHFKNLRFKPLAGAKRHSPPAMAAGPVATASPTPIAAMVQTDPSQARIEVLKEQGLNVVEWALSPLDQTLPPDIRQNIALLREDLLDEAKQKPTGSEQAYTLGSQLCDKLLIALEERNQASVEAGYTAALADAGVKVTSQALEVRRNYQMSWTQYQREESQRSEIGRQQMSAAEVKKEKIKVNWAVRTESMRRYLDSLYRQFREAMR